jgi:hypothetical protein
MIQLQGKIKSINPGDVCVGYNLGEWSYYVQVNRSRIWSDDAFNSPSAAKQAMREEIFRLRRVHGLSD